MDIPDEIVSHEHKDHDVTQIDYIEKPITYQEFFMKYLQTNKPCILGPWATDKWKSRCEWIDNNEPDLNYLAKTFGDAEGPTANCGEEEFCSHPKENKTVRDYIDYLKKYKQSGYSKDFPCLYLKDWHFTRLFPDYIAYTTPIFFQSDWLNEFWDSRQDQEDDYRFVYIGPKGSWTPFHADVFRSYSWSANICGKKKWIFFPPGEEGCLKDKVGTLVYDVRSSDINDPKKYPQFTKLRKRFEVEQNSGEIIFVPSGWHHQVHNMEDTISINHNWINGNNIELCWKFVKDSLKDVQKEIQDCKDMDGWHQQCQLILKASSGIDYAEFYTLLHTIGAKRLDFLGKCCKDLGKADECNVQCKTNECTSEQDPRVFQSAKVPSQPYYLTKNHAKFDISKIKEVITDMIKDTEFKLLDFAILPEDPRKFLKNIDRTLHKIAAS